MALNKKKLLVEIERNRREQVRAHLARLDEQIAAARRAREERVSGIKTGCRVARLAAAKRCAEAEVRARFAARDAINVTRRTAAEVRELERVVRGADRRAVAGRSSSRERRQESDDEVRSNLEPEMVPVFNVVARHIKPGLRKSRTETFLQWAEENPNEIYAMQSAQAERELDQLLKEREASERVLRKRKLAAGDVPF